MANVIITPNMSLVLPIPGLDPGPDWATNLNTSLTTLDSHNHASGSGVQISPDGLNISSDLTFKGNNATLLKSARFSAQSAPIANSSPNVGCLYVSGNELYYNDVTGGHQVQLTSNGSVPGSSGTITGLPSGTASAAYSAGTFTFLQATSTGANMDTGSLILRYPGSYPSPSGNYIAIQAPSSLSTGFAYTLPASLPGSTTSLLGVSTGGAMSNIAPDNSTVEISSTTLRIKDQGVTQAKKALRAVTTDGTNPGAGGVSISPSCGTFSSTAGSYVDVTNLSCTLTTLGNPVNLKIISSGGSSGIGIIPSSSISIVFSILRDAAIISLFEIESSSVFNLTIPSGSIQHLDAVAAGTYVYKVQARIVSGTGTLTMLNSQLVAYEE